MSVQTQSSFQISLQSVLFECEVEKALETAQDTLSKIVPIHFKNVKNVYFPYDQLKGSIGFYFKSHNSAIASSYSKSNSVETSLTHEIRIQSHAHLFVLCMRPKTELDNGLWVAVHTWPMSL